MAKKVIVVVGNICAGKSTCVGALAERLGDRCVVVSVDDYRVRMGVGSFGEDVAVWDAMLADVLGADAGSVVVLECSGTGVQFRRIMKAINAERSIKVSVIKLDVRTSVARERYFERQKKGVWLESKNINESIERIGILLMNVKADVVINANEGVEKVVGRFLGVFGF
jgi:predicted kinase